MPSQPHSHPCPQECSLQQTHPTTTMSTSPPNLRCAPNLNIRISPHTTCCIIHTTYIVDQGMSHSERAAMPSQPHSHPCRQDCCLQQAHPTTTMSTSSPNLRSQSQHPHLSAHHVLHHTHHVPWRSRCVIRNVLQCLRNRTPTLHTKMVPCCTNKSQSSRISPASQSTQQHTPRTAQIKAGHLSTMLNCLSKGRRLHCNVLPATKGLEALERRTTLATARLVLHGQPQRVTTVGGFCNTNASAEEPSPECLPLVGPPASPCWSTWRGAADVLPRDPVTAPSALWSALPCSPPASKVFLGAVRVPQALCQAPHSLHASDPLFQIKWVLRPNNMFCTRFVVCHCHPHRCDVEPCTNLLVPSPNEHDDWSVGNTARGQRS